jgi:sarcosine oxidase subunit beta
MNSNFDVLIIGAGVIGSSIAYHLAGQGVRLLVIERAHIAENPAASWASAGGVRRQGRHHAEARLAGEAIARWLSLADELEDDLHYRRGGNLLLAESEEEAQQLVHFVQRQHELGFTDVRLLDREETIHVQPGLADHIIAASYSPDDGQADPVSTTRAFANAARRLGAEFLLETRVHSLLHNEQRIQGVSTAQGDFLASHVVLAAGAWGNELAAIAGLRLPLHTVALQMLLTDAASEPVLQPVLGAMGRKLSLKQLADGAFLVGGGWQGEVLLDTNSYILRPDQMESNWQVACSALPALAMQQVVRSWCGLEAECVDRIPLVGPVPGWQGLILALGFSGHGFALSPAIGRAVANRVLEKPAPELDDLLPGRFAHLAER